MDLALIERLATLPLAGLLLLALYFQHRQSERQRAEDRARIRELEAKLEGEHQARLQDLTANAQVLLEVHDRSHKTVDVLAKQMEQNEQQQARRRP